METCNSCDKPFVPASPFNRRCGRCEAAISRPRHVAGSSPDQIANPTTTDKEYSDEELGFMKQMETYQQKSGRKFPTWHEVLSVFLSMGYRKVAEPGPLPKYIPKLSHQKKNLTPQET